MEGLHLPLPSPGRFAAVDACYSGRSATGAIVVATGPTFGTIIEEKVLTFDDVAPYRPGSFYERELPIIRRLLQAISPVDLLVVDGYVDLDGNGRPGLGRHAHAEFGIPVIGVAKSEFRGAAHATPVIRGHSRHPLFVTAAGLTTEEAAAVVVSMTGPYRLPDGLRRVDALTRGLAGSLRRGNGSS